VSRTIHWLVAALVASASAHAQGSPAPSRFNTYATFSVDRQSLSLTTAIATIEPSRMAPSYSWLRVYFYSFAPTAGDVAEATRGSVASMDRRWQSKSSNPSEYNSSRAVLQLTVDKDHRITQADLSLPGHTCTVASTASELGAFAQSFVLDANRVRLASKNAYVCDMTSTGSGKQSFAWNVDVDVPVFAKAAGAR
jgi:hypothetical protein